AEIKAVEEFNFDLATPLVLPVPSAPTTTLPEQSTVPLPIRNTSALLGHSKNENLAGVQNVGDINGDRFDDFVVTGDDTAYVLLGPIDLTQSTDVQNRAEIVVDTSGLGRPASRMGDIDGDGWADLAFVRVSGATATVTVVFGRREWPRALTPEALEAKTLATLTVTGVGAFEVHVLNWVEDLGAEGSVSHDDV